MKTPTWGLVVGILMIVFGGCGAVKNVQSIMMPRMLEMQKQMFKGLTDGPQATKDDTAKIIHGDSSVVVINKSTPFPPFNKNMSETMDNMLQISDFQKTWVVRLGYIGFIPTFIYIFAGIFLLIRRKFSLKLAYGALILSILFSIIRTVVLMSDSSSFNFMAITQGFGQIFGVLADVVLIIVISVCDKSAYLQNNLTANSDSLPDSANTYQ